MNKDMSYTYSDIDEYDKGLGKVVFGALIISILIITGVIFL